jgi:hypothetical protein
MKVVIIILFLHIRLLALCYDSKVSRTANLQTGRTPRMGYRPIAGPLLAQGNTAHSCLSTAF